MYFSLVGLNLLPKPLDASETLVYCLSKFSIRFIAILIYLWNMVLPMPHSKMDISSNKLEHPTTYISNQFHSYADLLIRIKWLYRPISEALYAYFLVFFAQSWEMMFWCGSYAETHRNVSAHVRNAKKYALESVSTIKLSDPIIILSKWDDLLLCTNRVNRFMTFSSSSLQK